MMTLDMVLWHETTLHTIEDWVNSNIVNLVTMINISYSIQAVQHVINDITIIIEVVSLNIVAIINCCNINISWLEWDVWSRGWWGSDCWPTDDQTNEDDDDNKNMNQQVSEELLLISIIEHRWWL